MGVGSWSKTPVKEMIHNRGTEGDASADKLED